MIELRWLKRWESYRGTQSKHWVDVLQYRTKTKPFPHTQYGNNIQYDWAEWQDVPVVLEDKDNA